jgi:putative oxidoreductase
MLNSVASLGKYLFIVPFIGFGVTHLMSATNMISLVPGYLPGGVFWIYLTGAAMLAFAVSVILGRYDKLAAGLAALMLLGYILMIHLPGAMGGYEMAISGILKDIGLMGGSLMYAKGFAKDNSIVG